MEKKTAISIRRGVGEVTRRDARHPGLGRAKSVSLCLNTFLVFLYHFFLDKKDVISFTLTPAPIGRPPPPDRGFHTPQYLAQLNSGRSFY